MEKKKILNFLRVPLNWIIIIAGIFGTYYALRWLGLKGIVGIIIGLTAMAYLIFSQNPMLIFFTNLFRQKEDSHEKIIDITRKP